MKLRQVLCSTVHQFTLILVFVSSLSAAPRNQLPVGTRPIGMGESFLAVADDANAIFWNPAGLVQLRNQAVNTMYTDLYSIGLKHSYLGYALPITDRHAIGIDWAHLGFDDDELNHRDDRLSIAYGIRLIRQISLGTNLKLVNIDTGLDGSSLGSASGFGVDVGVRLQPIPQLSFGILGQDLTDTKVKFDKTKDTIAPRRFRIGVAYKPTDTTVIALDIDDCIHLGAEQWFAGLLALRGGIAGNMGSFNLPDSDGTFREPISFSLGGSLKYNLLQFDYAYLNAPMLPDTHRFSMTFAFDSHKLSLVNIESIRLENVLASFYRQYAKPNILNGEVVLTSKYKKDLLVSVSIYVPKYMDRPTEVLKDVLLPAATPGQESKKLLIPVSLVFNEAVRFLEDDMETEAVITISYPHRMRTRQIEHTQPITLRRMGQVAYRERLNPMVAFIDPADPVVKDFATAATSIPLEIKSVNLEKVRRANDNIFKAMQVFEALNAHGVKYKPHRDTPFQLIYARQVIMDANERLDSKNPLYNLDLNGPFKDAKYPRDLLSAADRTGDCDDLSVLYASLLEALGIRTKLVDIGERVFVMFDSGLSKNDINLLQVLPELFIEDAVTLWVPVDVTRYGDLFVQAWKEGASQYAFANEQGTLQLVDVHAAWETYPPMYPPTMLSQIPPPDTEEMKRRIHRNLTEFEALLFGQD